MKYLIAHDLGTSGNKASLFTTMGQLVKSCTIPYEVDYFGNNCAQQDPEDWWKAVCTATRTILEGVDASQVLAVSFSAQMQCCLLVDEAGEPLYPAIIWADGRSVEEAAQLDEEIGADNIYEITGHRLSPNYSIEKLMWMKKHEPEVYGKAYRMLQAKDYVIYRLTGAFLTDCSDASGTNAYDLSNRCWSEKIIAAAGVRRELFPEIHTSTDVAGYVTSEAAQATGLSEQTAIVCGGGDGPCSAVGAGCVHENEMFTTFGTSAWIGGTMKEKFIDEDQTLFCFDHVIPGYYMPCGTMQAAGSSYSYIRHALCEAETKNQEHPYDIMNQMIEKSPAGAKNLIFLPYMLGERAPRWNPDTSGAFLGIKMKHQKEDYVRAVLEGVAYNLELILQAYRKYLPISEMILTGGGAKGATVCQILADVMQAKLTTPNNVETATSIGAAVIAGVGAGVFADFEAVDLFLQKDKVYEGRKETQAVYAPLKKIFDDSYCALQPVFEEFAEL
ncbi:MAG: xylulokinase [Lachnospiraceae bacterium]|nr:xylulokinase [Lachnospiraceae bacterium]